MSVPLPKYAKIKDRYCISYYGNCREYLVQLRLLRPLMEKALPGIEVYISGRDDSMHLLEDNRTFPKSRLEDMRGEIAYIRDLSCNMDTHPVEALMKESDLPCGPICHPSNEEKTCLISPIGCLPTRNMTTEQITRAKSYAEKQGYQIVEKGPVGWVIGVENEDLFLAGAAGKRVSLVPTGIGENLFRKMFPAGEILRLECK